MQGFRVPAQTPAAGGASAGPSDGAWLVPWEMLPLQAWAGVSWHVCLLSLRHYLNLFLSLLASRGMENSWATAFLLGGDY